MSLAAGALACSHAAPAAVGPAPADQAAAAAAADATRRVPVTTPSERARDLYLESERLRFDARMDDAQARLEQVLVEDPTFARALVRIGTHLPGEQRTDYLARARARAEQLPPIERRWVLALVALAEGRGDEAYAEVAAVAALAPDDWIVQMIAAELAQHHQGKPKEARPHLERAIAADPTRASPYNMLAYNYVAERDFDGAIAAITRYAELAPGEPNPLDSKGEILLEAGRFDEAEAAFRAALAIDPGFRAEDGIAAVQLNRGETAAAVTTFERAWKRFADQPLLRWELGTALLSAYLAADRPADAAAFAPSLAEAAAGSGHYRPELFGELFRARVALHREQWRDAHAILDAARTALGDDADPRAGHTRRAIELFRLRAFLGQRDVAAADTIRAALVAATPDDPTAQMATLLVAHARNDLAAAKPVALALFASRAHGGEAKLLVADLAAAAGHADKAKALRTQVATTYGRDPRTFLLRRRAERALAAR